MKVLGIAGSPRSGGNTDILLERVMSGAAAAGAETETLFLRDMDIAGCLHCDGCLEEGRCVIDDDMQQVYPRLREADRLVIASPMFFMGLTSQTKAMVDRCQALWALRYVVKQPVALNSGGPRRGLFVAVGGTGFAHLFEPSLVTIRSLFAVIEVKLAGEVTYARIDEKGAIKQHPTALDEAFAAGRGLVEA